MKKLLLLAVLMAGLRPGLAATTPRGLVVDDLTISPHDHWWRTGSMLLRAEVRNPTAADQRVRIRYGGTSSDSNGDAFADLDVPAGGRSICALPLPRSPHGGEDRLYAIDASGRKTAVSDRSPTYQSWSNGYEPLLYVSRSLSGERLRDELVRIVDALKSAKRFGSGSPYGNEFSAGTARAGDFAEPWPGDWRAYSVFSGVFVAERDLPDLSASAKTALRDYAAAGGCVFLVGAAEIPAEFLSAPLAGLALPNASPGATLDAVPSASLDGTSPPVPLPAMRCGLGLVAAVPSCVAATGSSTPTPTDVGLFLVRHLLHARILLGERTSTDTMAGILCPSDGDLSLGRPPVGAFLLILLAFAVLAGPVSLWILARRNRRIHILWVLPALSAAFSVAILLSLLVREGVTPTLAVRAGVLLDQRAGRACSFESDSFYSPLSLGAVDFPVDAAVAPVPPYGGGIVRVGRTARYEGWLSPRTPGAFHLAAVRATPLRLSVRADPATGALAAVNAFGAPIDELYLLDDAGLLLSASGIAPGATAPLDPLRGDDERAKDWTKLSDALRTAIRYGAVPVSQDVLSRADIPTRRFYVAVLPAAPFSSDPLPGRKAKRTEKTVVYGIY